MQQTKQHKSGQVRSNHRSNVRGHVRGERSKGQRLGQMSKVNGHRSGQRSNITRQRSGHVWSQVTGQVSGTLRTAKKI